MAVVVGIILFLIVLGLLFNLVEAGTSSRLLRPYIGLLLIAALIAGLGVAIGVLFNGLGSFFFFVAKIVAALTCAGLCLHLIVLVSKRWL
jgi:hypothetical protein